MTPLELRDHALARLVAQANLQVWDGEPASGQTSLGFHADELEVAVDEDGRAHQYAALYVGPGWRTPLDDRLVGVSGTAVSTFQVTAAGGDLDRALKATSKVLAALDGHTLPNGSVIRNDVDTGLPRIDRDPTPSRHFLPLIFRAVIA